MPNPGDGAEPINQFRPRPHGRTTLTESPHRPDWNIDKRLAIPRPQLDGGYGASSLPVVSPSPARRLFGCSGGAVGLVSNKQHTCPRVRQQLGQVTDNAAARAHARTGNDDIIDISRSRTESRNRLTAYKSSKSNGSSPWASNPLASRSKHSRWRAYNSVIRRPMGVSMATGTSFSRPDSTRVLTVNQRLGPPDGKRRDQDMTAILKRFDDDPFQRVENLPQDGRCGPGPRRCFP